MKIKAKVTLGVIFLFAVILTIGGLSLFYLGKLSDDADNILADNYESVLYAKQIIEASDSLQLDSLKSMRTIGKNLALQEGNITEPGERELTGQLRLSFERMKTEGVNPFNLSEMRARSAGIQQLNMLAIKRKNELAQQQANNAATYLILIAIICTLIAFSFIVNFPAYIADPIAQLTKSIKLIAGKNYEERLSFERQDEFEELAEAFNQMAEKLDEYEHSNLAKVIFEKKRIETIINRMTDPVIGLDESDKIIFANERALDLLQVERAQLIDRQASDLAVKNELLAKLIQPGADGKEALIKSVIKGKDNYFSREAINVHYTPTGENEHVSIGKVILLKNVTSYKELDLAKTYFIATISHELKTPIASLQMCARLLQDSRVGELNAEQKSVTQTLADELARLTRITNELLDLSQVETGNIKLNIGKSDPNDIITRAAEAVRFHAEHKKISIAYNVTSTNAPVQADADKTTWVLVNFLTNAIRYSPEGALIEVQCKEVNGKVSFSVTDKGCGIDPKYVGRIFEKFFQVPGSAGGTGLGLAISKEFIEAQGGQIHVSSEPGKGSTFSFDLLRAN